MHNNLPSLVVVYEIGGKGHEMIECQVEDPYAYSEHVKFVNNY